MNLDSFPSIASQKLRSDFENALNTAKVLAIRAEEMEAKRSALIQAAEISTRNKLASKSQLDKLTEQASRYERQILQINKKIDSLEETLVRLQEEMAAKEKEAKDEKLRAASAASAAAASANPIADAVAKSAVERQTVVTVNPAAKSTVQPNELDMRVNKVVASVAPQKSTQPQAPTSSKPLAQTQRQSEAQMQAAAAQLEQMLEDRMTEEEQRVLDEILKKADEIEAKIAIEKQSKTADSSSNKKKSEPSPGIVTVAAPAVPVETVQATKKGNKSKKNKKDDSEPMARAEDSALPHIDDPASIIVKAPQINAEENVTASIMNPVGATKGVVSSRFESAPTFPSPGVMSELIDDAFQNDREWERGFTVDFDFDAW